MVHGNQGTFHNAAYTFCNSCLRAFYVNIIVTLVHYIYLFVISLIFLSRVEYSFKIQFSFRHNDRLR